MSIQERLKQAIDATGKNLNEVSELIGMPYRSLQNYVRGERDPKASALEGLVTRLGISVDWLITGEGPMFRGQESHSGPFQDPDYTEVPLYDIEASAGHGSLFDQERIGSHLKFRNDWLAREGLHKKDLVAIRVSGDSMDGTLADGDAVLIDRSRKKPDGVFAIRIGDALRIKRLQKLTDGSLRVSSDNEMYREEIIHPENMDQVEIVGQCYWRAGRVF